VIDLAFVARALPKGDDLFWRALDGSGLTQRPCPPEIPARLDEEGIAIFTLPIARAPKGEIDREAAVERAREKLANDVEELERRIAARAPRLIAFLGTSLYAAALGPRAMPLEGEVDDVATADDDDAAAAAPRSRPDPSERSFASRARFGGAVAVAIPHISRQVPPALFLERMRALAELRRELSQRNRGAHAE
jgi:hypothetical protein